LDIGDLSLCTAFMLKVVVELGDTVVDAIALIVFGVGVTFPLCESLIKGCCGFSQQIMAVEKVQRALIALEITMLIVFQSRDKEP